MDLKGWLVSYLFRWFPAPVDRGLFALGRPDDSSPVIVTANFWLTVKRVRKALRGHDIWLLVVNTQGINVWCAAVGGIFTSDRVVDGVKVSRLADRVSHRNIILPALAAPGLDLDAIERHTGFRGSFGPVYAHDIPAYLGSDGVKNERMIRFHFNWRHRLDMLVSMNFLVYVVLAVAAAAGWPRHLLALSVLYWLSAAFLYLFVDRIPGRTGWTQSGLSGCVVAGAWCIVNWIKYGSPLYHWGWLLAVFLVFFTAGLDLAGIATPRRSDPESLMVRLGLKRLGGFFKTKAMGPVYLDRAVCIGCGTCRSICPIIVFGGIDTKGKMSFSNRDACFACGACIRQCPVSALSLGKRP